MFKKSGWRDRCKKGEILVISGRIETKGKEGANRGANKIIRPRLYIDKEQEDAYLHIRLREEVHGTQVTALNRVQLNNQLNLFVLHDIKGMIRS
jgi:hypothetical protein